MSFCCLVFFTVHCIVIHSLYFKNYFIIVLQKNKYNVKPFTVTSTIYEFCVMISDLLTYSTVNKKKTVNKCIKCSIWWLQPIGVCQDYHFFFYKIKYMFFSQNILSTKRIHETVYTVYLILTACKNIKIEFKWSHCNWCVNAKSL